MTIISTSLTDFAISNAKKALGIARYYSETSAIKEDEDEANYLSYLAHQQERTAAAWLEVA